MLRPPLTGAAIARLVPHAGTMCLLDRAEDWNETGIRCSAVSQASSENPLRRDGLLPAICGLEYALQAMALHGALTGGNGAQRAGYLVSLRGISLSVERLDDIPGRLLVTADVLMRNQRSFIYGFALRSAEEELVGGQAAVILPGADP
jgi:predicted hotdog family 3-hydroxylacyl-ACP dehydratase